MTKRRNNFFCMGRSFPVPRTRGTRKARSLRSAGNALHILHGDHEHHSDGRQAHQRCGIAADFGSGFGHRGFKWVSRLSEGQSRHKGSSCHDAGIAVRAGNFGAESADCIHFFYSRKHRENAPAAVRQNGKFLNGITDFSCPCDSLAEAVAECPHAHCSTHDLNDRGSSQAGFSGAAHTRSPALNPMTKMTTSTKTMRA